MGKEPDNRLEPLPLEGEWWLPENARARWRADCERRGLPLDGGPREILDDSQERGRQRVIARYDLPADTSWLEIHHHLIGIGVLYPK